MTIKEMNELLVFFSEIGRLEAVIDLISRGANPNYNKEAAMTRAWVKGHRDVLDYLRQASYHQNN